MSDVYGSNNILVTKTPIRILWKPDSTANNNYGYTNIKELAFKISFVKMTGTYDAIF